MLELLYAVLVKLVDCLERDAGFDASGNVLRQLLPLARSRPVCRTLSLHRHYTRRVGGTATYKRTALPR